MVYKNRTPYITTDLNTPMGLCYVNNTLYVADWGNSRIVSFNGVSTTNTPIPSIQPYGLCSIGNTLYISGGNSIFSFDGVNLVNILTDPQYNFMFICTDNTRLYVSEATTQSVIMFVPGAAVSSTTTLRPTSSTTTLRSTSTIMPYNLGILTIGQVYQISPTIPLGYIGGSMTGSGQTAVQYVVKDVANRIFIAYDGTYTKMVDMTGMAYYYMGPVSFFTLQAYNDASYTPAALQLIYIPPSVPAAFTITNPVSTLPIVGITYMVDTTMFMAMNGSTIVMVDMIGNAYSATGSNINSSLIAYAPVPNSMWMLSMTYREYEKYIYSIVP